MHMYASKVFFTIRVDGRSRRMVERTTILHAVLWPRMEQGGTQEGAMEKK